MSIQENTASKQQSDLQRRSHWLARNRARLMAGVAIFAIAGGLAFSQGAPLSAAELFASGGAKTQALVHAAPMVMPDFANLAASVKPAVVSVRVKADATVHQAASPGENPFEGTPFERFFRDLPQNNMPGRGRSKPHLLQAQGSGFFVSSDGYIVTNNHVVDGAVKVEIVTDAGNVMAAKVVGTDPKTDLALLKVDAKSDFPFVKLADNKPRIGEWVVAMGNPFGLGGTVTAGIVSATGRDIGSGPYDDFLQIDAPVNKGNSGGPTFNLKGEVVGVNTAIFSPSGGSVGIAFDIPATTVASVIPQLRSMDMCPAAGSVSKYNQ
ncbi:MAG: trypsin-like peptidase domain-containing protein [Hyphomicrobiaceae bacterium]